MSIEFEMDDFVNWVLEMSDAMVKACERGAGMAGSALLSDTIMDFPQTPLDEGTLRGSGSVFVQNALTETAPNSGGTPTPASVGDETLTPDVVTAVVGFNTPYAAYQHEGERKEGTHVVKTYGAGKNKKKGIMGPPGTGKKFLEKKLFDNENEYVAIVANEVKKVIGNG